MNDDSQARAQYTSIIQRIEKSGSQHAKELLPLVYSELRALAHSRLLKLPKGITIQATALVHEAYIRLAHRDEKGWDGRKHFFYAASRAMRDILVEDARSKASLKKGADLKRVTLSGISAESGESETDLILLEECLIEFEEEHPEAFEIISLRFFCGLSMEECAELSDQSLSSVKRKWRFGRAWLLKRMSE